MLQILIKEEINAFIFFINQLDMGGWGGGATEDNSKIIFLILKENICCDPSLELSQ